MNSEQFGKIALEIFNTSNVPGSALDSAVSFRDIAISLSSGDLVIVDSKSVKEDRSGD